MNITTMMSKPIIAIDFDGTLVEDAYPGWGAWKPGAIEALRKLSLRADIVVHTCRISHIDPKGSVRPSKAVSEEVDHIRKMLDSEGLEGVRIYDNIGKPGAVAYVDDKALYYSDHIGWDHTMHTLERILDDIKP